MHCHAVMSGSVAVIIAYLMKYYGWMIVAEQMRDVLLLKRRFLVVVQALKALVARKLHHCGVSNT